MHGQDLLIQALVYLTAGVISVPIAGGPRQVILGNIDHPANLVVDGKDLLVVEDYSGNIIRTPAGGGNVGRTKIGPSALGLAVSGGFAYTASLGPQPQIWKLPVAGGPAVSLAAGGLTPYALATDGKWVYWVDYGEFMKKNGALYRVSVSGGPVTQLAAKLSEPEWLDIDPTYVYWTETTKVVRTPR